MKLKKFFSKRKKAISSLLFSSLLLMSFSLIAQNNGNGNGKGKGKGNQKQSGEYCGNENDLGDVQVLGTPTCDVDLSIIPIKTVRVQIHVFQDNNGNGNIPNTSTGKNWIETIVKEASKTMGDLKQMNIASASPYVKESKIRYKIVGTHFWENTAMWQKGDNSQSNIVALTTFVKNQSISYKNTSIHILIPGDYHTDGNSNAGRGRSDLNSVLLEDTYYDYYPANRWYEVKSLLNHELGHALSLLHSWAPDGLDDTPTNCNCWNFSEVCTGDPFTYRCPCSNIPSDCNQTSEVSNNMMDYNASANALTLDQASKAHAFLQNSRPELLYSGVYAPAVSGAISSAGYNGPLGCCTINIGASSATISNFSSAGANSFDWTKLSGSGSMSTNSNGTTINLSNLGSINLRVNWTANCHKMTKTYSFYNSSYFFLLGPNPTNGDSHLELKHEEELLEYASQISGRKIDQAVERVSLHNDKGVTVWDRNPGKGIQRITIPVGKLKNGTYILFIKTGELIIEHKLIKM